ncbi:MAG: S9 family peptidase, partial [Duncaniella sp.]|nr:S9 family peptidase [Duncaniella sp.]
MKSFLTLSIIVACANALAASPVQPEVVCDWSRAEHFSGDSLQKLMHHTSFTPSWIDDTPYLYYSTRQGGKTCYKLVNAATGAVTPLIKDPERFARDFTRLTGDTVTADNLPVYSPKFKDGKMDSFTFRRKGKYYRHNIKNGTLRAIKEPKNAGSEGRPLRFPVNHTNADSTFTMMGCEYDMYCRDNKTGVITRVTTDGKKDASHTYSNKPDTLETNVTGWWMGNRFIQPVYDQSEILETGLIETIGHSRPKVNSFRMPMPGDAGVKQTRIYWFNPETGEGRYLPIEKYPDQVVDINYHHSGDYLYFTRRSRGADHIDLCRVYVLDGTVNVFISEDCKPHMNMT